MQLWEVWIQESTHSITQPFTIKPKIYKSVFIGTIFTYTTKQCYQLFYLISILDKCRVLERGRHFLWYLKKKHRAIAHNHGKKQGWEFTLWFFCANRAFFESESAIHTFQSAKPFCSSLRIALVDLFKWVTRAIQASRSFLKSE